MADTPAPPYQELIDRRSRLRGQMEVIDREAGDQPLDAGRQENFERLQRGLRKLDEQIEEAREQRIQQIARIAQNPANLEAGTGFDEHRRRVGEAIDSEPQRASNPVRDVALRAIEQNQAELSSDAGDRLTALVKRDRAGIDSRYLAAVSSPEYNSAFGLLLEHGANAHLRMSREEQEAVRVVSQIQAERAMTVGVDSEGGFAVPFTLDPTIILTSDGSINPLRQLARVRTITTKEWRGVDSTGVTASYAAEEEEVGDNSPTLGQPAFTPQRAHQFVPFSYEVGQDWSALQSELAELFADAKDQLEAEQFVNGDGVAPNPEGLVAGLPVGSIVATAAPSTFALGDVYALQESLPARFQPRARFLSSNTIINTAYRFVGTGDPDEPRLVNDDRTSILGRPFSEVSTMATTTVAGDIVMVYGDLQRAFQITDRIGMSVELIPHLFGANRRPTGQRGLYAFWRNTAGILVPNAVRGLRIDTP